MSKQKNSRQKLYLSFSVDWEGENFDGVKDLSRARDEIESAMRREIPLTHFICPAYYTNQITRPSNRISSVYRRDMDEIACHAHCWKSLVKEARVKFRTGHDWHAGTSRAGTGHGVPLGVYGDDILPIVELSNRFLEHELNLDSITSFRAGGAMTSDAVFDALVETGIKTDSSAFPPSLISKGYHKSREGTRLDGYGEDNGPLTTYKMGLWGGNPQTIPHLANTYQQKANNGKTVSCLSQPYFVTTNNGQLMELPITGGISDYVDMEGSVWPTFTKLLTKVRKGRGPAFFHLGCHQEGDVKYKRPFVEFFQKLSKACYRDSQLTKQLEFLTVDQTGRLAESLLEKQPSTQTLSSPN